MQFIKLETEEQLRSLEQGDLVIVKWGEYSGEYENGHPITANFIWKIVNGNELILNKKSNSYFNIDMYLRGESNAKEAYLVKG